MIKIEDLDNIGDQKPLMIRHRNILMGKRIVLDIIDSRPLCRALGVEHQSLG